MFAKIEKLTSSETALWDEYVHDHPNGSLYHLSAWRKIFERSYGHKTYYLIAKKEATKSVVGILPLVHLKHFLFGNQLTSIPFFDIGGILADDEETEQALLLGAMNLGQGLKVNRIELRHLMPLECLVQSKVILNNERNSVSISNELSSMRYTTRSHKVRMLLNLPESSEILMKSFKAKLRSQIKKTIKEGLKSKVGGTELVDDFYDVFTVNMRDLGSPVHSKHLIESVVNELKNQAKIVIIYKNEKPLACSMVVGFKDTLENPWASALREYSKLSPNMLLYWTMLEYACDNGYKCFDFGRSTQGEGTYKFKEQWGAKPTTINWHYIRLNGKEKDDGIDDKAKFGKAVEYWKKLPVCVSKIIGPRLRKYISL